MKPFVPGCFAIRSVSVRPLTLCLLAASLAALLRPGPARSLTEVQSVTPDPTPDTGMTVKFERAKERTYTITVTRYPQEGAGLPAPGAAPLEMEHKANLEIRKEEQLIARTRVAADKQDNTLVYSFDLARDCIKDSHFYIVEEDIISKDNTQPRRLGRVMFEIDMKAIDRRIQDSIPQHP